MATPSLAASWSLDTSFPAADNDIRPAILASTSPPELALFAVTSYCCSRWGAHYIANLAKRTPSTETRLRNEGFIPLYKTLCDVNAGVIKIAQQNQISLPPLPAPLPDYEREASDISKDTLGALVLSQAALPIKPMLDTAVDLMRQDHGYHWGSVAAFVSVSLDAYISAVVVTKESKSTPGERTIAPFIQPFTSENTLRAIKVVREELVRCREEASSTGWKDNEAQELAQECVKHFGKFSSVGL